MLGKRVFVVGVGMTKFIKPGREGNPDYHTMAAQATQRALADADISYDNIEQACVGYVFGDSTSGQRAVYEVGMSGIPVYNVNNNCSTGSTALFMARNIVRGGQAECVLALGFEKMEKGSLGVKYQDRENPLMPFISTSMKTKPFTKAPMAPQLFGNAGIEHMEKYGTTHEQIAKVSYKNHKHSVQNPYSQFRDEYKLNDIMSSPVIYGPLNMLSCCPTSDGAAAAIIVSEEFVIANGLQDQAVEIVGQSLTTDKKEAFEGSMMELVGYGMSKRAATEALGQAGLSSDEVDVVELHDCFATNEVITYEALGLCPEGKAGDFIDAEENTYGGKVVVNPSGGLISKGHPLGATGLAQCSELVWQLRGMSEERQVDNVKVALQHNLGLGGACVVTVYKKYNDNPGKVREIQTSDPEKLEALEKQ